jgi:two-component system NtrC family sensor kinase
VQNVAVKLLMSSPGKLGAATSHRLGVPHGPMNKDFQIRFTAGLLFLLTVAACAFAWINFQKEHQFQIPTDGVWWVERSGHLVADHVEPGGPADKAGVREGDQLSAVNSREVRTAAALQRQLYSTGAWLRATYSVTRDSVPVDLGVLLVPADRSRNDWLRLISLIYLGIGLYVLLRRWTAPSSTHFYIFCLVSFILYSFHYTGKLNEFDWVIYWGNVVAWLLQPALFLHFVLTFP